MKLWTLGSSAYLNEKPDHRIFASVLGQFNPGIGSTFDDIVQAVLFLTLKVFLAG
ncbi:hypothetical protein R2Q26_13260 [Nitrosomonas sp. Is37]|nr:hypothetical protein [Nitrosomonas sp. Is37]MDV6345502.1 hypothetical protein [Nitrosomonas sp. Is37]